MKRVKNTLVAGQIDDNQPVNNQVDNDRVTNTGPPELE